MSLTFDQGAPFVSEGRVATSKSKRLRKRFRFFATDETTYWLVLKLAAFSILTLGIYRFWGKTNLRRYLWSSVEFAGDRFVYIGTARELFIGFLIALAVLLPLFGGDYLLQRFLFVWNNYPELFFVSRAVFAVLVVFLVGFALFRMRRYQLSRTVWRGIRFGLDGSAVTYAGLSLAWLILSVLTLGLAYPWANAWQIRYIVNHAHLGQTRFSCRIGGGDLIMPFMWVFVPILSAILFWIFFTASVRGSGNPFQLFFGYFASVIMIMIGFVIYRLNALKAAANLTRFAGYRFRMKFSLWKILLFGFLGVVTAISIFIFIWVMTFLLAKAIVFSGQSGDVTIFDPFAMMMLFLGPGQPIMMIGTLIGSFLAAVAGKSIFGLAVLRAVIPGSSLEYGDKLEKIVRSEQADVPYGEGYADALDVSSL